MRVGKKELRGHLWVRNRWPRSCIVFQCEQTKRLVFDFCELNIFAFVLLKNLRATLSAVGLRFFLL